MTDILRALHLLIDKQEETECMIEAAMNTFLLAQKLEEGPSADVDDGMPASPQVPLSKIRDIFEGDIIRAALDKTGGNIAQAAELLGEPRSAISLRVKVWKLKEPDPDSNSRLRLEIGRFLNHVASKDQFE